MPVSPLLKRIAPISFTSGCFFLLCLVLLVVSVPRFVGSIYALYPETLLKQKSSIADDVYLKAIEDLEDAIRWHDAPVYWQELGLCYLQLYNSSTLNLDLKQNFLTKAQFAIANGLKGSPVDPFAWFRLAAARDLAGDSVESVEAAYQLSLYTGRVEPELVMPRLIFGYRYLYAFDPELRQMWLKQIPIAFQFQPAELVSFAVHNPPFRPFVDAALLFDKDKLNQFNQSFEKFSRQTPKAH